MFIQHSIRRKLITISLALLIIPSIIMAAVSYTQARNNLNELGEQVLKNSVQSATQLLHEKQAQVATGELSEQQAKEQLSEALLGKAQPDGTREITYPGDLGEYGYLYAVDDKGVLVMHPTREGQSLWGEKDTDNEFFIREVIEKGNAGGGFTKYYFALPHSAEIAQKITYSLKDETWGWHIVAGTYMQDFNAPAKEVLTNILLTLAVAIIIGVIVITLLSNHIAKPLGRLANKVAEVAEGNLTIDLDTTQRKDEVGQLKKGFNEMVTQLRTVIGGVEHSITEIKTTSTNLTAVAEETTAYGEEIVEAVTEVATRAEQQAHSAENTNEATASFAQEIDRLHERNGKMHEASSAMQQSNAQGIESLQTLKSKSQETYEIMERMQNVFSELTEELQNISGIVASINGISEQTNLLALNASIEAARAGEHGKGFAVVAEEVRKLADQTVEATNLVRDTLQNISVEATAVTKEMANTRTIVQQQNDSVAHTESAFTAIEAAVNDIVLNIKEVVASVDSISESKDTMTTAIIDIADLSGMNAAATEEVNASVEEQQKAIQIVTQSASDLTDEIQDLTQAISRFTIK